MYTALYRRFRPEIFSQVLGQEHIVKILSNQIAQDTTGHAYLFCGTRGTGKTTMARLLAKGVNCLADSGRPCGECANCLAIKDGTFVDVIEIDAASNNGVDNIRELRESVKYPPSIGRRKVYIVDEVHMLSTGAFNALLKTLEEPPSHVMFVLATTEPQKLPATILSRCLRLDFKRVGAEKIRQGMKDICTELGVEISDGALMLLSANADGSVRDGLSLLDQCVAAGEGSISRDTVLELLGSPGEERLSELTRLTLERRAADALILLDKLLADGNDERQLMRDWIEHFRSLMLLKYVKHPEDMLNMSVENAAKLKEQADALPLSFINEGIFTLAKALNDARWSSFPRILLELALIKISEGESAPLAPPSPHVGATAPGRPHDDLAAAPTKPPVEATALGLPQDDPATAPQESPVGATAPGRPPVGIADTPPKPESASFAQSAPPTTPGLPQDGLAAVPPEPSTPPEPNKAQLWASVAADAARERGMLTRLNGRSKLLAIGEKTFEVVASDETTKRAVDEARELLERIMEAKCKKTLRMECHLESQGEQAVVDDDFVKRLSGQLNVNIEME